MAATPARAATARAGSERGGFCGESAPGINPGEAAGIQRLFAFPALWKNLGKLATGRLPDPDRFAKRPASQGFDRPSGA